MTTFEQLGVPAALIRILAKKGVTAPFPIQTATIAESSAGRDLCGRAPTGSGKTLAFAIPLALRAGKGSGRKPAALVLVPTRELASQVAEELRPLAAARGRTVATFFGGTTLSRDQRCIRRGVDIAVACPGRLGDLVRRRDCDLSEVRFVVIDEADRMADMGFLPEVKRLLDQTSPERQTLLFSATLDGDVDVLISRYQNDPVRHEVEAAEEDTGEVDHIFWHAESSERVRVTSAAVKTVSSAIVFTRTKHSADRVARQLQGEGVTAAAIHGNRSQKQRERALSDFTSGRVATLVATDVAARGIHVDAVGMVVHFDPPATDKDYVHRSGRTGRAGADGVVVTLVGSDKMRDVKGLQRALSMPQGVHPFSLEQLAGGAPLPAIPGSDQPDGPRGGGNRNGGGPRRQRGSGGGAGRTHRGGSGSGGGARPKPHAAGTGARAGAARQGRAGGQGGQRPARRS